jgi:choline monooxygenase
MAVTATTTDGLVNSIPAHWYTDPARLELERASVLGRGWQYLGDATEVAGPGSYSAADLGGMPVVVTRDRAGVLRGLVNVCRHRGSVIAEGCGRRATLQCPYHGWTYDLDGALRSTPQLGAPDGVRLPEVAVATVGPLLFGSTDLTLSTPEPELHPFLDLVGEVAGIDLGTLRRRTRLAHVIDANWKVVAENFVECYHCPLVHSKTLPGFGGDNYEIGQVGPLHTQHLVPDRFAFAHLFPNTQLSAFGTNGAFVARALVPEGHARTRVILDYWFVDGVADAEAAEFVDWFELVISEDLPLCESVQRGLASGGLDAGILGTSCEPGVSEFQRQLVDALDTAAR